MDRAEETYFPSVPEPFSDNVAPYFTLFADQHIILGHFKPSGILAVYVWAVQENQLLSNFISFPPNLITEPHVKNCVACL